MKDIVKFIVFIEVLSLIVTALVHLVLFLMGYDYPNHAQMYWIVPLILLAIVLFVIYIIVPLFEWWME